MSNASAVDENQTAGSEEETASLEDLMTVLRKRLGSSELEIVNISAKKFALPGESFCSTLAKVSVTTRRPGDVKGESLNLIMKRMNSVKAFVEWPVVFKKEVLMYTDLIPAYQSLERESGIKASGIIDIVPKYFGHRNSRSESAEVIDKDALLLLEDLNFCGYYVCDRFSGLDFDHAKKALSALSHYHALGIALKYKRPVYFQTLGNQIKANGLDVAQMKSMYRRLYKTLRDQPAISRHFSKIEPCFVHRRSKGGPWLGVTHGDFRLNNLLFHKDGAGHIDGVKIIDFQIYSHDSPLKDVVLFCNASLDDETLADRLDDLLDYYCGSLMSSLSRLGCDMELFSRADFERELKEQALSEFPLSAGACKFVMHQTAGDAKDSCELIDAIMQSECSEAYVKKVLLIIGVYERKGWF